MAERAGGSEIYEERMNEMRNRLDKLKEKTITSRNFNDLKSAFWSVLNQSDVVIMDLEKLVMQAEENIGNLVKKAEDMGLPTDGNHYFHSLVEAQKSIDFLKEDLDWRNFEFEIMKIWMDKLSVKVIEANDLELQNIKLQAQLDMKKEDTIRMDKEMQREREQRAHELEVKKMELQSELRNKESELAKIKEDIAKSPVPSEALSPGLPPIPTPPAPDRPISQEQPRPQIPLEDVDGYESIQQEEDDSEEIDETEPEEEREAEVEEPREEKPETEEEFAKKHGVNYDQARPFLEKGRELIDRLLGERKELFYIKQRLYGISIGGTRLSSLKPRTRAYTKDILFKYLEEKANANNNTEESTGEPQATVVNASVQDNPTAQQLPERDN